MKKRVQNATEKKMYTSPYDHLQFINPSFDVLRDYNPSRRSEINSTYKIWCH